MANTVVSYIWQRAVHTTNHYLLAAKQESYQKAYLLVSTKKVEELSGKKGRRMGKRKTRVS